VVTQNFAVCNEIITFKKQRQVIGYITVGTNNLENAVAFYDALFADLGAGRFLGEA